MRIGILRSLRSAFAALAISILAAGAAHADIRAYNAALTKGDLKTATAEAKTVWETFDKNSPKAPLFAREFAFTAMRAEAPDEARVYAAWLSEHGPKTPNGTYEPVDGEILLRWSEMAIKSSKESRQALDQAIAPIIDQPPGPSRISAFASFDLYRSYWHAGYWKEARAAALRAEKIATQLGNDQRDLILAARLDAIAIDFSSAPYPDDWFAMADLEDRILALMGAANKTQNPDIDSPTARLYFRASAWRATMEAYFGSLRDLNAWDSITQPRDLSSRASAGSKALPSYRTLSARRAFFDAIRERGEKARDCGNRPCVFFTSPGALPQCTTETQAEPPIRYPSTAGYTGKVGALILKITTDEAGAMTDVKVLGAVPSNQFEKITIATVMKWKLIPAADAQQPCTLAKTWVQRVIFRIG